MFRLKSIVHCFKEIIPYYSMQKRLPSDLKTKELQTHP